MGHREGRIDRTRPRRNGNFCSVANFIRFGEIDKGESRGISGTVLRVAVSRTFMKFSSTLRFPGRISSNVSFRSSYTGRYRPRRGCSSSRNWIARFQIDTATTPTVGIIRKVERCLGNSREKSRKPNFHRRCSTMQFSPNERALPASDLRNIWTPVPTCQRNAGTLRRIRSVGLR